MGAFTIEGIVAGVFVSGSHTFSKRERQSITLLPGLGIEGDAHCGSTVQHLSDRKKYPNRPNLRQLHLIQTELIEELNATGFDVRSGDLGENITTRQIDLPALPQGRLLRIGDTAVVEITGLRTPCSKIEGRRHSRVLSWPSLAKAASSDVMTGSAGLFPDVRIARSSPFSPRLSAFASIEIFSLFAASHIASHGNVIAKETEHFPSSVRPSRIGIGSSGTATRPSVASSMDTPLL